MPGVASAMVVVVGWLPHLSNDLVVVAVGVVHVHVQYRVDAAGLLGWI